MGSSCLASYKRTCCSGKLQRSSWCVLSNRHGSYMACCGTVLLVPMGQVSRPDRCHSAPSCPGPALRSGTRCHIHNLLLLTAWRDAGMACLTPAERALSVRRPMACIGGRLWVYCAALLCALQRRTRCDGPSRWHAPV